jgi:cytochrome c551/c552
VIFDACHLPGLRPEDVGEWSEREAGDGLTLRFPVLEPDHLREIAAGLRAARLRALAERPVASIITAIDAAAARLADPGSLLRALAEHALPIVTGYSAPMVQLILDRMSADWRRAALEQLVVSELGRADAIDSFGPGRRPGVRSRAYGPELSLHIFAGNVPGVGVTSLVRAQLVRSAAIAKTAADEPILAVLFARALAEVAPDLASCIAVTHWPGGSDLDRAAAASADTIVVYGGAEAVRAFRRHAAPTARVIEHGPRLSVGLIGREALATAATARPAAHAAARAVATFDQQGCVSPHAFFVETGAPVEPRAFARMLASELDALEAVLPRGRLDAAESAVIHAVRATAEFRAIAGDDIELIAGPGTSWTVIYAGDGAFEPVCLNRTVRVLPVASLEACVPGLLPFRALLQTVGLTGTGSRTAALAHALGAAGATRIAPLERMPWPPPDWHHDGRGPLQELVRWVDLEE